MNLRLNQGAIVEFSLSGGDKPTTIVGKVVNVFPDEVELYPQLSIIKDGNYLDYYTADDVSIVHLRRNLITHWKYVPFSNVPKSGFIATDNSHNYQEHTKPYSEYTINKYENGFCKGNGPYLGNIKEYSPINSCCLEDDGK